MATDPEPAVDPIVDENAFPVVGIGASAGGLQAYQELLSQLPVETGMAYVLVQHLDRSHESRLVELLSRSTPMPVAGISDGLQVQPNHVYVIPPNATLQIEEGRLRLAARAEAGPAHPVDEFFASLAHDRGPLSIAVILSGSGTDGAMGVRDVKAAGGITFAQTEASALHAGMPSSAIATGSLDFVLPPAEIARELTRLSAHPYLQSNGHDAGRTVADARAFQRVLDLIRVTLGVDFRQYRDTTVRRRILRRVALQRLPALVDYVGYLEKNRTEIEALYEDLLINVTSFFREPEAFEALREIAFPEIIKDHPADTAIRVWVPACSTGQEAYSLAISLVEFLEQRNLPLSIQVFATDISDSVSLSKARLGRYPASIESEVSPERLRRFFVKDDVGYRVAKNIRNLCLFAKQNVTSDPPFSRIALISCRNLFIYLSAPIQHRVLSTFHFALNAGGFLILGRSETAGATDLFKVVDQANRIYAKQSAGLRKPIAFDGMPGQPPWPAPAVAPAAIVTSAADWRREADRTLLGQYAPPGVLVDSKFQILQFRGRTNRFLEPAAGEASLDLMRMAHEGLLPALRHGFEESGRSHAAVRVPGIRVRTDGEESVIDLRILPVRLAASPEVCYLVLFDEAAPTTDRKANAVTRPSAGDAPSGLGGWWSRFSGHAASSPAADRQDETTARLTSELSATRDYLQSIVEQRDATYEELRSANEEVLSSNEELQSTNEELETAKEELQSLNEELTTVNEQLIARNVELVHTNDDLVNLLRSPALPIVMVGADLRIRRITSAAAQAFSLQLNDVGRPLADLLNLGNINLRDSIQSVIVLGQPATFDVKLAGGRWHLVQIHPYRTTEDQVDGAVILAFDVDDTRQAEARVRESQELVRAVVDTTRTALVVLDGQLRVLMANPAFHEAFGSQAETTIGRAFDQLDNGQWDITGLRQRLAEVLSTGQSLESEELTLDHSEQPRTILLNARRLAPSDGQAIRLLLAFEDITSRRAAEHELRTSESRYRQLFENSREGIVILDSRTQKVRDVNRFFCNILEVGREDVLDRELWQLGLAKDADASRAVLAEIQQQGYARYEHLPLTRPDGRSIEVEFLSNFFDVDGERVIQCVIREVTERKGLEADLRRLAHELAQADRRKTQFLATLAHELRNPLAPIVTGLHILRSQVSDAGKKEWAIGVMGRQVKQMVRLIDDLLDLSRITRGTIDLRLEPVDVSTVIDSAVESVRPAIQTIQQVLHVSAPPPGDVTLNADPTRLSQMIANLLANASKYTEPSGEIWLTAAHDEHGLTVSVRDSGIGIAPEALPHIFDMFFQADPPIGRVPGGLGIGLTLVRTIAELHGGSVQVQSEGLGRGTEFKVWLPLSIAAPPEAARSRTMPSGRGIAPGPQRILVVDDNEDSAEALATALRLRGLEVRVATDGERAVEVAQQWLPKAIFLDLGLPGLSGYTVASRLRAQPAFAETLIIAFTGYGQEEDRKRSRESGVDHHIVKPYDIDRLFQLLRPSPPKH